MRRFETMRAISPVLLVYKVLTCQFLIHLNEFLYCVYISVSIFQVNISFLKRWLLIGLAPKCFRSLVWIIVAIVCEFNDICCNSCFKLSFVDNAFCLCSRSWLNVACFSINHSIQFIEWPFARLWWSTFEFRSHFYRMIFTRVPLW